MHLMQSKKREAKMLKKLHHLNANGNGNIREFLMLMFIGATLFYIYAVFGSYVPASEVEKEFIIYQSQEKK